MTNNKIKQNKNEVHSVRTEAKEKMSDLKKNILAKQSNIASSKSRRKDRGSEKPFLIL